jgi:hypothetical protein
MNGETLVKLIEELEQDMSEANSCQEIKEQTKKLIEEHDKEVKSLKQERDDWKRAFYHAGLCIGDMIQKEIAGDENTEGIQEVMERLK